MPRGRPSVGREQYIRIKLRKDTHCLWVGVKRIALWLRIIELSNCQFHSAKNTQLVKWIAFIIVS